MNLGELIVELSADSSDLEKTLERAKKKAYEAAMSVEKSFEKINLNINVDDDSLTDLNKHLNLKVQHLKEVNKYFNNNPIVVNVDDSQLTDLNKHLHIKVQHLKEVNKYYDSNPIKINTDTTRLDDLEDRLSKLSNKTITITVESELSKQLEKSLVDAVKEAVKDGMESRESESSKKEEKKQESVPQNKSMGRLVFEGMFTQMGETMFHGLSRGLKDVSGADIETIARITSNMILRYAGAGREAQNDSKDSKKRSTKITKDALDAVARQYEQEAMGLGSIAPKKISEKAQSKTTSAVSEESVQSKQPDKTLQKKINKIVQDTIFDFLLGGNLSEKRIGGLITKTAKKTFKTLLPHTYSVIEDITTENAASKKTTKANQFAASPSFEALKEASVNLNNAAKALNEFTSQSKNVGSQSIIQPIATEQVATTDLLTPLALPTSISRKSKEEPELIPVENTAKAQPLQLKQYIPSELKKHIESIQSSTIQNIELSKQYAQATAKENNSPLALDIKKKQDISLKDVKAKFDAIKKYFAEEYKRLLLEFNEVKLTGTVEDIKAVKNKLIAFKSVSKSAIADIDAIVKEAEKAGYDKKINSPLTEIHKSGKQGISRNANEAGRKADQLKNEEVDIFNKQLKKYAALAEEKGIDVVEGLKKGIANKSTGVSDQARKMLDDLIETVESRMKIQSPSLVMFEVGMMIASGLFLGMQKGNSQVAVGARQLVSTIKSAVGSAKEILEPALAIGSVVPGVSTAATYGSVGLAATDSGLKMLDKVGERHAANPDQTLFQSAFGSGKDFIAELRADKTLTKPREAFDHFINLSKAGATTLGVNSFTTFDAAQAGMTALLRSSAAGKAIVQSHGETKYRLAQDPSLDYMTTYKAVLTDKLKDLKLTKPEIIKAIGSALKVVPTGFGTAANSVAETAGMVLADGIDALTIPRNLYRNISSKTAQGVTHQQAIAESITDLGAPVQVANAIGNFGDKHSVSLNAFARMSGNVVENINKALINTVAASSKVVSSSTNAISHQVQKNMGHGLPTQQSVAQPSSQSISSAAVASNSVSAKPFASIGGNIMKGLGKGMADSIGSVTKVMDNAGNAIQSQIKQNMGIQSPSKVMIALGLMIASGLAVGIKKGVIDVSAASEMLAGAVDDGIKELNLFPLENISVGLLNQLLPAIKKDFGSNTILGNLFNSATNAFSKGGNLKDIGINFIGSFGKGVLASSGGVLGIVTAFAKGILSAIKKVFRIASPSGEGIDVGENVAGSTGTGIDNQAHRAVEAARNMAEDISEAMIPDPWDMRFSPNPVFQQDLDLENQAQAQIRATREHLQKSMIQDLLSNTGVNFGSDFNHEGIASSVLSSSQLIKYLNSNFANLNPLQQMGFNRLAADFDNQKTNAAHQFAIARTSGTTLDSATIRGFDSSFNTMLNRIIAFSKQLGIKSTEIDRLLASNQSKVTTEVYQPPKFVAPKTSIPERQLGQTDQEYSEVVRRALAEDNNNYRIARNAYNRMILGISDTPVPQKTQFPMLPPVPVYAREIIDDTPSGTYTTPDPWNNSVQPNLQKFVEQIKPQSLLPPAKAYRDINLLLTSTQSNLQKLGRDVVSSQLRTQLPQQKLEIDFVPISNSGVQQLLLPPAKAYRDINLLLTSTQSSLQKLGRNIVSSQSRTQLPQQTQLPPQRITSPLILPNSVANNPNAKLILPKTATPRPDAQIISPQNFTANPNAKLILPVVQGLVPAVRSTHSLAQNSISTLTNTNKQIRVNLDALRSGNKNLVFSRYAPIPDPWLTPSPAAQASRQSKSTMQSVNRSNQLATGQISATLPSAILSFISQNPPTAIPGYSVPTVRQNIKSIASLSPNIPFVPPTTVSSSQPPNIPPVPPTTTSSSQSQPPNIPPTLMNQYLSLGTDLVTNMFKAVNASIRQSTLSGYASLGQVMRNAVNAALFSLADTLRKPLHQALMSQTRSILPWFMKFIPRGFQLLPKLSFAMPFAGGMALRFGNSIVKNLLENNIFKEGGFLTNLLSSITKINLPTLSGAKTAGITGFLKSIVDPVPMFFGSGFNPSLSLGLEAASPLYDAFSGILGLDESTKLNPKKQAPTMEKVLQDQTKANREKAKIRDFAGAEASKELVETLGNTLVDNVLESLDIPLIPKSAVQIMIGRKLGQRSATMADSINALGIQKSKTEQLLERAVQSGKATPERIDRLTRMALRERGIGKSARNAMTADELAAARDNILNNSLDATKRERDFLQFEGDLEVNTTRKGTSVTQRTRDAKLIRILRERGVSNADIRNIRQSGNGLNDVAADLVNNPRTTNKGFVGKLTEAYAANDQDAMKELVKQGLRKTGMSSKQIDNIDPRLLDTATAGIMTTLSGLQAKFKEKGFNMGKALAKGFKDSMVNLANAKDDLEYNAKKALGQANFGDSVGLIFRRMFRGTVATQDQFKEMYNQMGSGVKKLMFAKRSEADEVFPNILQFLGSIGTTLAPITTMVGAITPLLLPLAPIITGIGMSVNMVMPHIARLIDGIQRVEILQRRFKFLGGSTEGGQAEFNYAKDMASKYNVPSEVAANSYSQLAIAARDSKMEGQGVKELFEGITASLSALGITGQDASLVFMAYTQILSKGKLSMEELRQQLGEKFPPAMGVFAKAMGVSVPEMNALVSSGGVLSQDILPKVAKVLKEDYGNAAANQAGGLVVALNKLGNVGFEITTIFTDKLGGTLGFFVGSFADILGVLSGALKELIPLGQSFMIGFAATISIGLTIILSKFKPLMVAIGSLQSFLLATFSAITTNMMPMIIGIASDVADGWMGAEKNLMDNMVQGVNGIIVTILGTIDSIMRSMSNDNVSFSSVFGNLIQGAKEAGNIVEWLKGIFAGFFKIIPSGLVELLAIVFMFQQATGLVVMALGPAIKGLWGGLTGMFKSTWGAFQGVMSSLKGLNELMMTSSAAASTAAEKSDVLRVRAAAMRASLAFLTSALTHFAIAYGILMFSKGDFSDPMRESINKNTADINKHLTEVRVNINKTTEAFNKATKSVSELGNSIRDALPAKGVQLDIRSLWGGGDWKWDDAVRATNRRESPGFMDVVGPGALAAGGAVAGLAALAAVASFATKASAGIAATLAAIQGVAGVGATKAAILIASQTSIGLMPRLLGILVPMLASPLAPWVAAIAGFVTALLVAAAALDLFAPKLTEKQYNELPQEIKDIINVRDPKNNPGDRLDSASQQVIKLHKDQVLNNQRLTEFAKSVGLDGNINNFIAPPVKAMPEKQRKEFEKTDSAKNINTEITDTKERLKGIENIGRTDVEKSAQRDKPIYKGVQEKLAQLEKNKRLLELQFMVNYGNKGEIDNLQNNIAKQTLVVKELQMREAQIKKEEIQFSAFGRPSFSGTRQTFKYAKKEQNYAEESQKLKALQQQKAQLQTNLNATVQRRLDFDQIKAIDVRLKKAVDEFIDLDEKLKFNPNDELRSKAGLKKELVKQLRKQREKLLDSFGDPTPWLKKALKSVTDEIAQTQARVDITEGQRKNTINNLRKYQEQLEKMLATVSKFGDISDLTGALYTKASNALKDAETKYNTDISKNKVASNQAQTRIYGRTNLTTQQIAPDLSNQQINDLVFQQKALEKSLATKITSLREYRAVLVLGPSDPGAVQAEIDKLQQDILKDKEQISQNILDIAKARRDANQVLIDQTKQVAEYYRASVREAETATIEYKKAIVSIKNQQFANRLRQALIGAGNNIVTEFVDTLINLFQQLSDIENINIDQQKQKLDYRNSIQDIEIKATELQRSLPGKIIPFDSNKINQYNQQLKGVGGTVLDINKEIQRINKMLGMDAVNSTTGFNNALERVVFTLTKIKNLAPTMPNPGNNIPKNKNDLYIPYKNINNPAKKPDPFNGLSLPTKSSNVPSVSAIASTPREMLVAGITSDVGYLPAVGKSPYLIAQATTSSPQKPKAIPSNAIVSPVSGKSISETVSQNYNKGWNWKTNQSARIYGDINTNVLSVMTGTLKKINNNTVELQRKINGKELRFRYTGLEIDESIKFNKNNVANVKAGQFIGKPIHDKGEGTRLFDFSVNIKEDGKSKYISAQKFFNNIVELKRINPLTRFFNWATGNHIDPAVNGLNLAPQNVDPSWFKQTAEFMVAPTARNIKILQQGVEATKKVVQSLQGNPNNSQSGTSAKTPTNKPTTKPKTPTKKPTTKPKTPTKKPTDNPNPKTVQDKSRELTRRANRGGTDSPNNNQRNVTEATNVKAGATRQNTEAQIRLTEEQKRRLVTDFLRGLNTSTIKAQNDLDDANLRRRQEAVEKQKRIVSNNPMSTEEEKDRVASMEKDLEVERIRVDYRKRLRNLQAPLLSDADFDRIQKQLSNRGIKVDVSFLKKLYAQLRSANAQEAATVTANLQDLEKRRPQWLKDFVEQQRLQREVNQLNRKSDSLGVDTGVLQAQLGLLKQVETSRPLDPKVLEIPKTEYQLGMMQAEEERLKAQANLLQMAKDRPGVYTSGEFKKRDEAIDKTYNLKLATLKLQFDTNDLAQKLKDEMNKLDAKIFLEEPTFKNLELQGKLFTATAAEGMVDLDNIYNQSLIDQRNATNRYEKEINETKANRLLDEKQKEERIKNIQENAILEQNVINETAYRGYRKGILQNQKLVLDIEVKMSDSAKVLLEGRANIAKNLGLDLAAERIDKQVAQLNLANEYKQRKIQVEQDVENLKLSDEDANTLRSNLDAEMSLKTKTIQSQYSELSQVIKSFVGGFKNSFKEFLLSTDDTGKAFEQLLKGLGKSVLDALAEIASKYMTDALFSWLQPPSQQLTVAAQQLIQAATALNSAAAGGMGSTFSPNGLPGDEIFTLMGSGSGIGSFTSGFEFPDISQLGAADFGSLDLGGIDFSGFAKGGMITEDTLGKIENFANGGIIGAMSKERSLTGRTPHLVVASEGERILNHKETAIWNRLQSGVAGFADGGIVGGKGEIASRIGSTTTVNVPVSVSVSNDSEVDSGRLSQTVQALVSDGIRRELRPGGSISRGNPYRR